MFLLPPDIALQLIPVLPLLPIFLPIDAADRHCRDREALRVDAPPEHAVGRVVVAGPDRLCRPEQRPAGQRAADGDERLFAHAPEQLLRPRLFVEAGVTVEGGGEGGVAVHAGGAWCVRHCGLDWSIALGGVWVGLQR